jgi:hypothetical protein
MTAAARELCYASLSELYNKYMNRPKVFGVSLYELMNRDKKTIPLLVEQLVNNILQKGTRDFVCIIRVHLLL